MGALCMKLSLLEYAFWRMGANFARYTFSSSKEQAFIGLTPYNSNIIVSKPERYLSFTGVRTDIKLDICSLLQIIMTALYMIQSMASKAISLRDLPLFPFHGALRLDVAATLPAYTLRPSTLHEAGADSHRSIFPVSGPPCSCFPLHALCLVLDSSVPLQTIYR